LQISGTDTWQLIQQGDKKAYEEAFKTYYGMLCAYAMPIIRDKDEAEEVVQNVFYNLWAKRESLQVSVALKPYLYRSVHNECLNKIKHQKVKASYAGDYKASVLAGGSSPDRLELKELGNTIEKALESLPEQCGIVFRMSRFEQLKYAEIAEKLGISVKTVEIHMGKALRILREKLKDYLPLVLWLLMIHH
jgi:RNA polymerase sigma-70 factor (family 1)